MRKFTSFFLLLFMMAIGMSAQTAPPSSAPKPDVAEGNVKSVYSDAYSGSIGFNYVDQPASCTQTTATIVEETLDNNKVLKISNFGLVNVKLGSEIGDYRNYLMFHIDIYAEKATKLAVGAIMWGPGDMANQTKVVDIKEKKWTQIDIPVSYFFGNKTPGNFYALRIYDVDENGNATETNNNDKTFWIDNVYLYNYEQTLSKIEVSANKLKVEEGRTEQINVEAFDQKDVLLDAEKNGITYTYSVDDNNNGSVDANGLYKAGTAGTTTTVTVTAAKGDVTLTKDITFENIVRPFRPEAKASEPVITDKNGNVDNDGNSATAISIYSDSFKNNKGFDFNRNPNGLTEKEYTDATIEADTYDDGTGNILKVSNFKRINLQLANEINPMKPDLYLMFHIDIFTKAKTKLAIAPLTYAPSQMLHPYMVVETNEGGGWKSFDLPIEYFQDENAYALYALRIYDVDENGNVITDGKGDKTFWFDNVYVYNYAQELAKLNPAFPKTDKAVGVGKTTTIVPTAIDTNGLSIRNNNTGIPVTYVCSIEGESNDSKVEQNSNGEWIYTAGKEGTRTVVTVTAKQEATDANAKPGMMAAAAEDEEVKAYVTIANVGDAPIIDEFKVAGHDNNVVTLKLHISSLQESADIGISYKKFASDDDTKGTDVTETIPGVPTNVDLLYRVDGLKAGKKRTFTLKATTKVGEGDNVVTHENSKTLEVSTLADYIPGLATNPNKDDADNVINLFCSKKIYMKSPLWGRADRDDDDPARNIKKGDRFFRLYTKTPMEIRKLQYANEEDLAAAGNKRPDCMSDKVLTFSYTPKFTDVQFGEDIDAPKRSFAKNFALVEASDSDPDGEYCLRITQFERDAIFFGGADGNIHKGFDCTDDAPIKLQSLEFDMLATENMKVKIRLLNLNDQNDLATKEVELKLGANNEPQWQHISIGAAEGFNNCKSNSGIELTRIDDYSKDDIKGMIFVDNIYYKAKEGVKTTLRQVNKEEADKLGYQMPDEGWKWDETGSYLVDKEDPKIKMAVIYGAWAKFDWEQDNKDTQVGVVVDNSFNWFDCRNVSGLDYQGTYPGFVRTKKTDEEGKEYEVSGNANAFVLTEAIDNDYTNGGRGITQPAFSVNNVYLQNGKYYAHHVMQYVRNNDYAPTNRDIENVTANGLYMQQAYNNDVYNTIIVPCNATITSTVKYKKKVAGSNKDSEEWGSKEAVQGVYHMTNVENRTNEEGVAPHIAVCFTSVPKETKVVNGEDVSYFSLKANEPYLVVADKVGSEDTNGEITGYETIYTIDSEDDHTSLVFNPEIVKSSAEDAGKTITFTGSYHEMENPKVDQIYVFAAAKEGEGRNTLRVGRLSPKGKLHQYRCYFEFEGFDPSDVKNLSFYMEENNGETTSIRLATDDEVRGIVGGIYSIDGKRISGNANDVNKLGLPKGMYIINGKKVVIK